MKKGCLIIILFIILFSSFVYAEQGLVAYYPFDNDSRDYSGNHYDGINIDAVKTFGIINGSYLFDSSSSINLGNGPSTSDTADFTVAAWIRTTFYGRPYIAIMQQRGGGVGQNMILINEMGQIFYWESIGDDKYFAGKTVVSDGNWHHIAVMRGGNMGKIYVDGILSGQADFTPVPLNKNSPIVIGRDIFDNRWGFLGQIDNFKVYNRTLSDSEIKSLYSLKNPGKELCNDSDDDGYGWPGSNLCRNGNKTDCNDKDSEIYPDKSAELLGSYKECDNIDRDCDNYDYCPACNVSFAPSYFYENNLNPYVMCQKYHPGGYLRYEFEPNKKFKKIEWFFNWSNVSKTISQGMYYSSYFNFENNLDSGGYIGPQVNTNSSGDITSHVFTFSIWGANDPIKNTLHTAHPLSANCNDDINGGEGTVASCAISDNPNSGRFYRPVVWKEGEKYKIKLQIEQELNNGTIWNATLTDLSTVDEMLIARIFLDNLTNRPDLKGFGLLSYGYSGFMEYQWGDKGCLAQEYGKYIREGPIAYDSNGKSWLPRFAWRNFHACYRSNAYSTNLGVFIDEMGKGVSRIVNLTRGGLTGDWWEDKVMWNITNDVDINTLCGNNKVDVFEKCDRNNLSGKSCGDFGFNSGSLSCYNNCSGFNLSACTNINSQNLSLTSGINFISFSQNLSNSSISNLIYGQEDKIKVIFNYNVGWKTYYPNKPEISNLKEIEAGKGYIFIAEEDVNLSYSEIPASLVYNFHNGWNLFGVDIIDSIKNTLSGLNYSVVYNFNGVDYVSLDENANLFPGKAYWIYSNDNKII